MLANYSMGAVVTPVVTSRPLLKFPPVTVAGVVPRAARPGDVVTVTGPSRFCRGTFVD